MAMVIHRICLCFFEMVLYKSAFRLAVAVGCVEKFVFKIMLVYSKQELLTKQV